MAKLKKIENKTIERVTISLSMDEVLALHALTGRVVAYRNPTGSLFRVLGQVKGETPSRYVTRNGNGETIPAIHLQKVDA